MEFIAALSVLVALGVVQVARRRTGRPVAHPPRRGSGPDDWHPLELELERARRYDRGFALLQLVGPSMVVDGRRVRSGATGTSVLELRRTDVAWGGPERLQLLVPEASHQQLTGMLRRLRAGVAPGTEVRVACFPEDGLTARALVEALGPSTSEVDAATTADGIPGSANVPLRRAREAS